MNLNYKGGMGMLTMTQEHDIRKMLYEEGKNISTILRETSFDRKTVRT